MVKKIKAFWQRFQNRYHTRISERTRSRLDARNQLVQREYEKTRKLFQEVDLQAHESTVQADQIVSSSTQNADFNKKVAYHLAVTDLFVEKALAYLENQEKQYKRHGNILFILALFSITFGVIVADCQMFPEGFICKWLSAQYSGHFNSVFPPINDNGETILSNLIKAKQGDALWGFVALSVVRAFAIYGIIALIAAALLKQGKAFLDQAERIAEKMHALRQGRLFVHLRFGKEITIDDFEKAFNWNLSQENAFTNMSTESGVLSDATIKAIAEAITATVKKSSGS